METMIAGGIFVSVGLMAVLWLTGTSNLWWTSTTQSYLRTSAQHAMDRVLGELRSATRAAAASPPNAVIAADNATLTFYLPADGVDANTLIVDALGNTEWDLVNAVQYAAAGGQLRRTQAGVTTVYANDVQSVRFDNAAYPNEIRVTLTLQKQTPQGRTVSATAVETVRLRN